MLQFQNCYTFQKLIRNAFADERTDKGSVKYFFYVHIAIIVSHTQKLFCTFDRTKPRHPSCLSAGRKQLVHNKIQIFKSLVLHFKKGLGILILLVILSEMYIFFFLKIKKHNESEKNCILLQFMSKIAKLFKFSKSNCFSKLRLRWIFSFKTTRPKFHKCFFWC